MEEFEQLNIFDMTLPKFRIDKPIRLIELFVGIGSQAMALRDLGADFEHYRVVEFDKFAIASYNAIHKTDFPTMDITKIIGADLGIIDTDKYCYIMTYSFPCQDLSVAGKQKGMAKGSGTRSGLLWEVERLLNEVASLPQVLVMENVPQVHSQANMPDFQKWIEFLESKGYSNYWNDLNAKDYGVAQNRDRCFMVSLLGKWNFKFPHAIPLESTMKDYLEDKVDEKYFISEKGVEYVTNPKRIEKKFTQVNGDIALCITAKGNENWTGNFIAPEIIGKINSSQDGVVFSINGISGTLTAGHGNQPKIIDKNKLLRKCAPIECWRLMGFCDNDFRKAERTNSDTQLWKQAGNSIVKDVLMGIFRQLIA